MPEIRLVAFDDENKPIESALLWKIGHPQLAKDMVRVMGERLRAAKEKHDATERRA